MLRADLNAGDPWFLSLKGGIAGQGEQARGLQSVGLGIEG
jgi:hypothetical protein